MCFPRVERVRRLQNSAIALHRLDLACNRRDDPVADFVENLERVVHLAVERLRPDDPGGPRLRQLDHHQGTVAPAQHGSAEDVVDIQHPARLLRSDPSLMQGEHRPLGDHEQTAKLGEPGDHVVGQGVRDAPRASAAEALSNGITAMDAGRGEAAVPPLPDAAAVSGEGQRGSAVRRLPAFSSKTTPRGSASSRGPRPRTAWSPQRHAPRPRGSGRAGRACSAAARARRVERSELQPLLQMLERLVGRDALTRRSSSAEWQARNRRRCAASQLSNAGLRSMSSPSRKSPANNPARVSSRPGASASIPSREARAISIASTEQSLRSSRIVSASVWTRLRPGSSIRRRILLRHQRSSPLGSFGTSHRGSQSWLRVTACGSERKIAEEGLDLARCRERQRVPVPMDRQPSEEAHMHRGGEPTASDSIDSTGVPTPAPTLASTRAVSLGIEVEATADAAPRRRSSGGTTAI